MYLLVTKDTPHEIVGRVASNHSMTFDEVMEFAGFDFLTYDDDGVECDGWYDDSGTQYDESVLALVTPGDNETEEHAIAEYFDEDEN